MTNITSKSVSVITAGAAIGIAVGWFVKSNMTKQGIEEKRSIWETAKEIERKVYQDGQARAIKIDGLKKDIQQKLKR
ncbi:MAG: hypothetical protein ACQEWU_19150 [Bacillota bacterium]|uniref:Uncharacterized protein n=1 Tax=Virgibacillus salarius TaxID=447199 RepID=A0A941DWS9_9BACI|nr:MULTISPECIES: hypothetical protein [Bacillaceae]NAZ10883.1 hypothetical protein [Agaribacter marinus]MBR7798175.1 hypothetical protein [Virgibacillus salarius]MCC2252214.1 hypothetical protein [Virgibacillus sp. AGTR]MDY7046374.1 hypothetical protein [Virgibacillus sp. M23]QRZ19210.1 hypothetical protein JUJ52_05770 [Virgibacillus sp. AGTR]